MTLPIVGIERDQIQPVFLRLFGDRADLLTFDQLIHTHSDLLTDLATGALDERDAPLYRYFIVRSHIEAVPEEIMLQPKPFPDNPRKLSIYVVRPDDQVPYYDSVGRTLFWHFNLPES